MRKLLVMTKINQIIAGRKRFYSHHTKQFMEDKVINHISLFQDV